MGGSVSEVCWSVVVLVATASFIVSLNTLLIILWKVTWAIC